MKKARAFIISGVILIILFVVYECYRIGGIPKLAWEAHMVTPGDIARYIVLYGFPMLVPGVILLYIGIKRMKKVRKNKE